MAQEFVDIDALWRPVDTMTDREIAEETLLHTREITLQMRDAEKAITSFLESVSKNPMFKMMGLK